MSSLSLFLRFLPQAEGLLPKFQLVAASLSIFNTVQNFATLKFTRRLYGLAPPQSVTNLHARTFAVWTLTSAVVRGYAAYHINNKSIYDMALLTYLIAFGHFTSEIFVYRTAKVMSPVFSTLVISTVSLVWMTTQYDFYVKA
ncbi:Erg28-like protein [Coniophora puteana RWD-64-598 SS2]|uniref:Erg28-like protein n=1 Tax=Coniophora puteana (strain RWD-64-598) TaxID=741705 RepID=A0A5M3MMQ9_CONPW|nr:Erg28-like protein [Coniophora puteana RWD-64-598 SS2]EIW79985.1 Erg28-like protein [Coniophora puteana RWD-64-598 SS2]